MPKPNLAGFRVITLEPETRREYERKVGFHFATAGSAYNNRPLWGYSPYLERDDEVLHTAKKYKAKTGSI